MHQFLKLTLLLLTFSAFCTCWWELGHQLVAKIAQERLSPKASANVKNYLAEWNGDLAAVSTWADEILSQPEWKFSAKFHYANTPDRSCNYLETRDCLDRQCIVGAIENYTMILRNRDSYSFNLTRDALRFIVHFLGDIHQPLHIGWESTVGGNRIRVYFFDIDTNLHKVWDGLLKQYKINTTMGGDEKKFEEHIRKRLNDEWREHLNRWIKCPNNTALCPAVWALESAAMACVYSYDGVENGSRLGEHYYLRGIPVVELRVAQGGIRLAALLNWIFN